MENRNISNECGRAEKNEGEKELKNSEYFSFVHTNAPETSQFEFPPNENVSIGEYASLNTPPRYSPTMEDSFIKTHEIDTSELDPFLQWQDVFDFEQTNFSFKSIEPNSSTKELMQKAIDEICFGESASRCYTGTTSNINLGMNSMSIDYPLDQAYGESLSLPQFDLYDPKAKITLPKETSLDAICGRENGSKYEEVESKNKQVETVSPCEYNSQNTTRKYSHTIEDSFMESQAIINSPLDSLSYWQDYFHVDQSNLPFNCMDPNSISTEMKVKTTDKILGEEFEAGWNKGTTSDLNLRTGCWKNVNVSENMNFEFGNLSLKQFILVDSEQKTSLHKQTSENVISGRKSESKYEDVEAEYLQFKTNYSVTGMESTHSSVKPRIVSEPNTLSTNTDYSIFDKNFHGAVCFKEFNTEDSKKRCEHSTEKQLQFGVHEGNVFQVEYLREGRNSYIKKNTLQCSTRDLKFPYKSLLNRHMLKHTRKNPFECEVCEKKFSLKGHLNEHMRIHTGEKPFQCEVCEKKFSLKGHLNEHMRIHTGEKPFLCEVCEKKFSRKGHLDEHMRLHTGEKPFQCKVCEKKFSQKVALTYHMRFHTGEKPFQCEVCEKKFSQKVHLTYHMRTHSGEKPYMSHVCGKRFTNSGNLNKHMRIHIGEKPFQCEVCEKKFSQKVALTNHMRIHTGEKAFQCHVCRKRYTQYGNLYTHMRIHTGEKPFQCYICMKKFRRSDYFKKHMNTHTKQ